MLKPDKPEWLKKSAPNPAVLNRIKEFTDRLGLHTVCENACCPNVGECFSRGVATFMIMGDICTRDCTFCAVNNGYPLPFDVNEPGNVVTAIKELGLRHAVITSVTRDDLPDGGARHFAAVVKAIRNYDSAVITEILVPDFCGSFQALEIVILSRPAIINHNVETVPRLYPSVRPQADYKRSITLLENVKTNGEGILTKSGLMLGMGEKRAEVKRVMEDLREVGCDLLTIGQYLSPSPRHYEVRGFIPPEEFEEYRNIANALGFKKVASAPYVRSSFDADKMVVLVNSFNG
ncbi:lipoyl synthase [Chloroflexota bacterium]